jgi:hypothetical protein
MNSTSTKSTPTPTLIFGLVLVFASAILAAFFSQDSFAQSANQSAQKNVTSVPRNMPIVRFDPSVGSYILYNPGGGSTVFTVDCYYANQRYSPGSTMIMPGGTKTCGSDGRWR